MDTCGRIGAYRSVRVSPRTWPLPWGQIVMPSSIRERDPRADVTARFPAYWEGGICLLAVERTSISFGRGGAHSGFHADQSCPGNTTAGRWWWPALITLFRNFRQPASLVLLDSRDWQMSKSTRRLPVSTHVQVYLCDPQSPCSVARRKHQSAPATILPARNRPLAPSLKRSSTRSSCA